MNVTVLFLFSWASFDEDAGGMSALEALQTYVATLDEAYGRNAFRYFSRADMRVLGEGR